MENPAVEADAVLIDKIIRGQNNAFNSLVSRWRQPIFHFLYRMVGNREEAEDLTQQAFISVYNNLSSLKDSSKFKSWLYSIAANKARDYMKSRKNNRYYSLSANSEHDDGRDMLNTVRSEDDTTEAAHRSELQDIIQYALERIPPEQKEIIVLKEYQGMTFEEIARIVGCSVNTVKSRMYYGLSKLKNILDGFSINAEEYYENV